MTFEEAKAAVIEGVRNQDKVEEIAGFRDPMADILLALVAEIERLQRLVDMNSRNISALASRPSA